LFPGQRGSRGRPGGEWGGERGGSGEATLGPKPFNLKGLEKRGRFIYSKLKINGKMQRNCYYRFCFQVRGAPGEAQGDQGPRGGQRTFKTLQESWKPMKIIRKQTARFGQLTK
jgi:hypothetical protein